MSDPIKATTIQLKTCEFRAAFPVLHEPKVGLNKERGAMYSIIALIPKTKDMANLQPILQLAKRVAMERWDPEGKNPAKLAGLRSPINDGDAPDKAAVTGYPGHWWIRFSSQFPPQLIDQHGNPLAPAETYGGMWGKAIIAGWSYDKAGNRGVAFNLLAFMKTREDEKFAGVTADMSAFAEDIRPAGEGITASPGITMASAQSMFSGARPAGAPAPAAPTTAPPAQAFPPPAPASAAAPPPANGNGPSLF